MKLPKNALHCHPDIDPESEDHRDTQIGRRDSEQGRCMSATRFAMRLVQDGQHTKGCKAGDRSVRWTPL